RGLRPFRTLHNIEFDVFPLLQRLESLPLKGGVVDEHILPALKANEPKPLPVIEPLHRTFRSIVHTIPPFLNGDVPLAETAPSARRRHDKKIPQEGAPYCGIVRHIHGAFETRKPGEQLT